MTRFPDFLAAAGFAFEKRRGVALGSYELAAIESAGLTNVDCERLADSIWDSLEKEKEEAHRVSAYWALGKQGRRADLRRFIEALRRELPESSRCVYQILIALENYGEQAFDRTRSSRTIDEEPLNRADALAYLARVT